MNIAFVIPHFDPSLGGAETWACRFGESLVNDGHQLHIVGEGHNPQTTDFPITWHSVSPRHTARGARSAFHFAQQADKIISQLHVDIVHDMGYGWKADLFQPHGGTRLGAIRQNLMRCSRLLKPCKQLLQPLLPRYRLQKLIELRRYSNPHAWFIALSKMVQKDMHHFYPLETERVHVIYNGVDTRRFSHRNRQQDRIALRKEWNIANDEVVLLIVAHNFALKGLRTVIESVALLNQRRLPVHLMVVGKDRIRPYRRRADQLGCLDRIHFLGSLGDTASCFAAADIYVHPTYYDPCSLVVLEALAMGLPVITSRFNGAGELITPGQQGYLVQNPSDSAELAAAILPLLQPEVRNEMSLAAHKLAQNHSHENNYQQILNLYHQILSARKHGPTSSLPNIPGRSVSKTG